MKRILSAVAPLAFVALAVCLSSCGDDEKDPTSASNSQAALAAGNAPNSPAAKTFRFTAGSGSSLSYVFTDTAFQRIEDGVTGTYVYTIKGNNEAGLVMTHADGEEQDLTLTFPSNSTAGSYTGTTKLTDKAPEVVSGNFVVE